MQQSLFLWPLIINIHIEETPQRTRKTDYGQQGPAITDIPFPCLDSAFAQQIPTVKDVGWLKSSQAERLGSI
jgi:hypothetical protein